MTATVKARSRTGKGPNLPSRATERFFQQQLSGEAGLTRLTAEVLYELAAQLYGERPWLRLGDEQLILTKEPDSSEMCYCSVMGALGEVFAVHAYRGAEGYRFFRRLAAGFAPSVGDFFATQSGVSVEFVRAANLTRVDREFLEQFGHPLGKKFSAPQFRALRPGYFPWYLTEGEGRILARSMDSVLAFLEYQEDTSKTKHWTQDEVYPQVVWEKRGYFRVIETLAAPETPALQPAVLDEGQLLNITKGDYPIRAVVEMDHFFSGAEIGKKDERKACLHTVLAADADTGSVCAVRALEPGVGAAGALTEGVLEMIEQSRFVPKQVCVRQEEYRSALGPLAERLGFQIEVKEQLPSLEKAKAALLRFLGERREH